MISDIKCNHTIILKKTKYQTLDDFHRQEERIRSALQANRVVIKELDRKRIEIRALYTEPLQSGYNPVKYSDDLARSYGLDALPFAIDELGNQVVIDFTKAPHMLMGGTTGAGKSAGVNTVIASLVQAETSVCLHLADPKAVELGPWSSIADNHATGEEMASVAEQVKTTMDHRYIEMEKRGVRNLADHPETLEELGGAHVLIIDELAEYLTVCGKEGGKAISSIAQKGRAASIFLICATQNPKADLFSKTTGTETLRSNLSNLVAFRVLRRADSDVILGTGEEDKNASHIADSLPGAAYTSFSDERIRVPYLDDDFIDNLVTTIKEKKQ